MSIEIIPIKIKNEIEPNDNLANLIVNSKVEIKDEDIIVVAQKIVSKQEGRIIKLDTIIPSMLAVGIASQYGKDPNLVEAILSETKRIVRMEKGILIVETNNGLVCANAGVDESNVPKGHATLLPKNPDDSAARIQQGIFEKIKKRPAVIISDTFGRPFRQGQTNVAIGVCGIEPILDYEGKPDNFGRTLRVTAIAIIDELCSAAELVMGKTENCPAAIIRNYKFKSNKETISSIIRPKDEDLFR